MSSYVEKLAREKGLKTVDADLPLSIEVTPEDVRLSARKNSRCCAFARAAQRLPKVLGAYFFRSVAWLEYADRLVRYQLPTSVQKEIVAFDRGAQIEAGLYQLSSVEPSGKQGVRSEPKRRTRQAQRRATFASRPLSSLKLEDLPPEVRGRSIASLISEGAIALQPPTPSQRKEAINARSAKRPGRHQPANSGIRRKIVHRTTGIRSLFEPVGDGDQ